MQISDDIYYIERVNGGDVNAFAYLVEKYKRSAYTFALKLLKVPEDAEETAHDAFVNAFQSLKEFRRESKFSTWLFRIIFNLAISRLRKKKLEVVSIDDDKSAAYNIAGHENLFNTLTDEEQNLLVRNAVDRLPDDERVVITLFYLNDCAVKEISEITGISDSNVKVKLFRARKRLWEMLK
ncbi:MAG TPA: sigma-70 family RNA polymerase sigma factor, partial [Bacteroidales bacterium]|nr:sigma-70 family RNA polymerase sigma factor [Bacteroidales bacterium]